MDRSQSLGYFAEKAFELDQAQMAKSHQLRYRIEWEEYRARTRAPRRRLALRAGTLLVMLGERVQSWATTGQPEWQGP